MTSQNNALVEIALALAMAFFSIMVLAMVSMKVHGDSFQQSDRLKYNDNAAIDIRSGSQSSQTSSQAAGLVKISRDEVVIYYEGKYYDTNLKKLTQHDLKRRSIKFLAVDPAISTAEAVRVRTKFPSTSLAVTLLNDEWLKALKEKEK